MSPTSRATRNSVVILLFGALLAGCSPSVSDAQSTTSTTASVVDACETAAGLIDAGKAKEALDHIKQVAASDAEGAAPSCEKERLAALESLASATLESEPTAFARFRATWDQAVESWITPLSTVIASTIVLIAALFVAARLYSLTRDPYLDGRSPGAARRSVRRGRALILIGTPLLVFSFPFLNLIAVSIIGGLLALIGTGALGSGLANLLRMEIKVQDKSGTVNSARTAQTITYLRDLGGSPPAGVEIPVGTDVTVLKETSLVALPEGKLATLVSSIIQLVLGTTPWRAVVDVTDDDSLSVQISRNGRSIASTTIRRSDYESLQVTPTGAEPGAETDDTVKSPPPPDLGKMVAASILITLSRHYDGFAEGLTGATSWKSVGLQYIATSDSELGDVRTEAILRAALAHDDGNLLARLSLRHYQYRFAHTEEELDRYISWLLDEYRELQAKVPKYLNYQRRLLLNYLIATVNLRGIRPFAAGEESVALQRAQDLQELLNITDPAAGPLEDPLPRSMQPVLDQIISILNKSYQVHSLSTTYTVRTAYNGACVLALKSAASSGESQQVARREALKYLAEAVHDPEIREWAKDDPTLTALHSEARFWNLLGLAPQSDYWNLTPFKTYRAKLEANGVSHPRALAPMSTAHPQLTRALNIPTLELERLIRLSSIILLTQTEAQADTSIDRFQVEMVEEIRSNGFDYLAAPVATEIAQAIAKRTRQELPLEVVEKWLANLRSAGAIPTYP